MISKVISVYPGRFQPFGPHHSMTFKKIQEKFGIDNSFIVTSNNINENSPFNFNEKKLLISKFGFNQANVVECENVYRPVELMERMNRNTTAAVFVIGEKDKGRLALVKKDGSPGYYREYKSNIQLKPITECSYVMYVPHTSLQIPGFGEMSGTSLREWLKVTNPMEFKSVMEWFDPSIFSLLKKKLCINENLLIGYKQNIQNLLLMGGAAGRLNHVYDKDSDLTFGDLKEIIKRAFNGTLNSEGPVTEKFDGVNLFITYMDNQVKIARNKGHIKNPIDISVLQQQYVDKPTISNLFTTCVKDIATAFKRVDSAKLQSIFKNGTVFANIEIVNDDLGMTIDYANKYIQIHNLYENGEFRDDAELIELIRGDQSVYKIVGPMEVELGKSHNSTGLITKHTKIINSVQRLAKKKDSDLISSVDPEHAVLLEKVLISFGADVINTLEHAPRTSSALKKKLKNSIIDIQSKNDPKEMERMHKNLAKISSSEIDKIASIEGIVFTYKGTKFKLTGLYSPVHQIIGIVKFRKN